MNSDPCIHISPADDLDAAFQAFWGRPATFVLGPGRYQTRGAWAHLNHQGAQATQGARIVGAGSEHTTICLADDATFDTPDRLDLSVLRLGANWGNNGRLVVSGISIDGRQSAFAGRGKVVTNGLRLWGNRCLVEDVRVTGLRGNYEIQHEAFGISTINEASGPHPGPDGGTVIRDCSVEDCAEDAYVSAFSVGYRPLGRPILQSLVERCRVSVGKGNYFAFGACFSTTFRDCVSSGTQFGFYNDTDGVSSWLVDACRCEVEYSALHLVAQGTGMQDKSTVRVTNSTFCYPSSQRPQIGLGMIDRTDGRAQFKDIVMDGCTFDQPGQRLFALVSSDAPHLTGVRITNCSIPKSASRNVLHAPQDGVWTRSNWFHGADPAPNAIPAFRA